MSYSITTQQALRAAFWNDLPDWLQGKARVYRGASVRQNLYPADTRMAWVDFVDSMQRNGDISESLAMRAIL